MNDRKYHGVSLTKEQYPEALREMGVIDDKFEESVARRKEFERMLVK